MTVILKDGSRVPIPEGYTLEEVLDILKKVGHEPAQLIDDDGNPLEFKAA